MSGLLNGPFCQIAGSVLETVCDHMPLGKVGFQALKAMKNRVNNSPKISEEEKIRLRYETIGAHIQGACKLLKPAMELKNILVPESKSADRVKSGVYPSANLHYYTPQKSTNQCRCAGGIYPKDFRKETQFDQKRGLSSEKEKENSKMQRSLRKEGKQSNDSDSDSDSDLKSKNSWTKCDACKAVSKSLIRTTCDHAICQKCVKSGKDCQKCLIPVQKNKNEPKQKLYPEIFDTD